MEIVRTRNRIMRCAVKWLHPKSTDQNLVCAFIHMVCVSLLSMSLVELEWFEIAMSRGTLLSQQQQQPRSWCAPFISITQFFTYGYSGTDTDTVADNVCLNASTVNMMRIIILLTFMAIVFSLCGFYVEIAGSPPQPRVYVAFVRRYALMSTCTVLWVMAVVASCYYVAILLEEAYLRAFPLAADVNVTYGSGFYLVAASGGLNLLGTFLSLLFTHKGAYRAPDRTADDSYLISSTEDATLTPPPPYNLPPPPYHP